jgi:hypothetical protein
MSTRPKEPVMEPEHPPNTPPMTLGARAGPCTASNIEVSNIEQIYTECGAVFYATYLDLELTRKGERSLSICHSNSLCRWITLMSKR